MTVISPVPFVDLSIQHSEIADEVKQGFDRVLATGTYILGPEVEAFERAFEAYCGVQHVVGVANGTDALELAFRAAGIEPGDEVIMPANTFVATAEAVLRAGASVRLVDCGEDYLIDPELVGAALTPRTRAVVGVHLYGQTAAMERLREVVPSNVLLVEDAAQSQGARRGGKRAGGLGDIAATSFYPGKNLGAYGDGGGVITDSAELAERVRELRNHVGVRRYEHVVAGVNSRLDGLQGVVLAAKLTRLDGWNQLRRDAAARYDELLSGEGTIVRPTTTEGNEHVFHLYVVRVPERDRVVQLLDDAGISTGIHYPAPLHLIPALTSLGYSEGDFPFAERASRGILSLPMYPGITAEQQKRVADALLGAVATIARAEPSGMPSVS